MTEEIKRLGRRNFLRAVATLPAAGALAYRALSSGPVHAAIVGVGGQGGVLLENADPAFLRIVSACDIYPPALFRAQETSRKLYGRHIESCRDYRKLLDKKEVEAIVIAAPLSAHEPIAVAALAAGKHLFIEKTMARTVDECRAIVRAGRSAKRVLQVGHQRAYNPIYREAREIVRRGDIGDVHHVRAVWHRNGDWRRKVPDEPFDPRPWGYDDMERLTNWRLYEKHSRGLWTELVSHQMEVVNWFCDRLPTAVIGSGGIHRYPDGREVADHVYAVFEYPEGLTLLCSSIQSNAHDDYSEMFFGTKGTLILTAESQAYLFHEDDRETATMLDVRSASGPLLRASASLTRDAVAESLSPSSISASVLNPYRLELQGFAAAIRGGVPVLCDGQAALQAAVPVLIADEAARRGERMAIPPESYQA